MKISKTGRQWVLRTRSVVLHTETLKLDMQYYTVTLHYQLTMTEKYKLACFGLGRNNIIFIHSVGKIFYLTRQILM